MIPLCFKTADNQILNFAIDGREIWYKDRVWSNGLRLIPLDPNINKIVIMSRNKIPPIIKAISQGFTEKDRQEYEECKTEEELAEKIRIDCKKKGLSEIRSRE